MPEGASASFALQEVIGGPPRRPRVLAAQRVATYVDVRGRIVAIVARGGAALPNAVILSGRPVPGRPTSVGGGRLEFGPTVIPVLRWWDATPRLDATPTPVLAERIAALERLLPPWPPPADGWTGPALARRGAALAAAVTTGNASAAATATRNLIGLGPGSTPSGDDVVAGVLAGLRLLGEAAGVPAVRAIHQRIAEAAAGGSTTRLSAALLAHATRGEVALPAGDLLAALTGRGDLRRAAARLLALGHTSGHDLAFGLLVAARAVVRYRAQVPA